LHLVGLIYQFISRMHSHTNIKLPWCGYSMQCVWIEWIVLRRRHRWDDDDDDDDVDLAVYKH